MTDPTDYTTLPEVLAACGMTFDVEWKTWRVAGVLRPSPETLNAPPRLTMQELWEGLCKACDNAIGQYCPSLHGRNRVEVYKLGDEYPITFHVNEYGSLSNCIAAALHWALQRGKKEE